MTTSGWTTPYANRSSLPRIYYNRRRSSSIVTRRNIILLCLQIIVHFIDDLVAQKSFTCKRGKNSTIINPNTATAKFQKADKSITLHAAKSGNVDRSDGFKILNTIRIGIEFHIERNLRII